MNLQFYETIAQMNRTQLQRLLTQTRVLRDNATNTQLVQRLNNKAQAISNEISFLLNSKQ